MVMVKYKYDLVHFLIIIAEKQYKTGRSSNDMTVSVSVHMHNSEKPKKNLLIH